MGITKLVKTANRWKATLILCSGHSSAGEIGIPNWGRFSGFVSYS